MSNAEKIRSMTDEELARSGKDEIRIPFKEDK